EEVQGGLQNPDLTRVTLDAGERAGGQPALRDAWHSIGNRGQCLGVINCDDADAGSTLLPVADQRAFNTPPSTDDPCVRMFEPEAEQAPRHLGLNSQAVVGNVVMPVAPAGWEASPELVFQPGEGDLEQGIDCISSYVPFDLNDPVG